MQNLNKKLWRELWQMRSQVLAIILVIAGGVAVAIMSLSTYESLHKSREQFYRDYHFADVFANVKRAPVSVLKAVEAIDGVEVVEQRVIARVNLIVPGLDDPASGLMISLSEKTHLNRLHLVKGRLCELGNDREVVISDGFSSANSLEPGDSFTAIINGHLKKLRVAGVALSPEYIYQIQPGAVFPDYRRFGVMWMDEQALSNAYDMDGAFNDVTLTLQPDASLNTVISALDNVLEKWGGQGAYGREDQLSNRFLKEEFQQLKTMAYLFPMIFLGVAMFLLFVVLTRMVQAQQQIIAVLKAFGYSNFQVGLHYMMMIQVVVLLGIMVGVSGGLWLGQGMTAIYTEYYRFPELLYQINPMMLLAVALLTVLVSGLSTLKAVYAAAALPPAEAMRPDMPESYSSGVLDAWMQKTGFTQPMRMILRNLQRKRLRALLTVTGLSMACAILMVGNFQQNAVRFMVFVQFELAQKQDIEVTLNEVVASKELSVFRALPGVYQAEGLRSVPVKLNFEQREYRTVLQGMRDDLDLKVILDSALQKNRIPQQGVLVTEHLAKKLGFTVGDQVWIELLEGVREKKAVTVSALSTEYLGLGVYMDQFALNRLMGEGPAFNSVLLRIDNAQASDIYKRLREMPRVAGINLRETVIKNFNDTLERVLLTFTVINAWLGGVIAFGVVYNTVRIALAERQRELASLRVLGYTHAEVSQILLGELLILLLISIPLGFVLGKGLCQFLVDGMQTDLYRVPLVLSPYTFSFSAWVVIVSSLLSALIVWQKLKTLNLVEALKTRE
ncbi:MAG: FtsX-like permease family protein [Pseudomonadales bacterium]|nr:FtsX-like permease family protein [Pseudomonadales bacterium]